MSSKRMVSVSTNQIHNLTTTDHGLVIQRQKISQCCVVGNVLSVNEQSTKTTFEITDYTGPKLEVVLWRSNSDENKQTTKESGVVMEQMYVKIFGQSRKDANGHICLVAFYMEPLCNLNDLTIHLLEVMRDDKDLKRYKTELMCHGKVGCSGGMSMNDHATPSAPTISGFSEIQNLVMNVIREDQSDNGISADEIFNALRSVKQETIKQTTQFLINEGHIYETVDDYHFKASG